MFEPHLELSFPAAMATLTSSYRAGRDDGEKVVVLEQVYDNDQSQTYIRDILLAMHREAGVRFVLVEGAAGPVNIPSQRHIPALRQLHSDVSAGALAAAAELGGRLTLLGVDDLQRHQAARQAQVELMTQRPRIAATFARLARLFRSAQRRLYPRAVIQMQQSRLRFYGPDPGLERRFRRTLRAARAAGADLRPFRLLLKAMELAEQENSFQQPHVVAEQAELSRTLLRHFEASLDQITQRNQLQAFLPYIQFWLDKTGRSAADFQAQLTRNPQAALAECVFWLQTWFAAQAHEARDGATDSATVMEEFMRLALRVGVPFFHLLHFRRAVAQQRQTMLVGQAITRNLSQILDCTEPAEAIIDALRKPQATSLNRLEERCELLRRALVLELIPTEAARVELAPGDLSNLASELVSLTGGVKGVTADADWEATDAALAHARDFYGACLERSALMADETVRLLRTRGYDRGALVVGGFHPDALARRLEADRGVSFSIVRPYPSL